MRLNTQRNVVESSGLLEETSFTVKASAKVFEALSSTIYKDKILAVVRELVCNMVDAHRQIGQTKPWEVKLPNWTDTQIIFKDYGPGLSPEEMKLLYTRYFDSTKDSSNDDIGGFGIGSKSPFCYVDQFNVESRHGGMSRRYVCYKDAGQPKLTFIGEQPCGDDTGLTISLSTKANDRDEFRSKLARVIFWFDPATYKISGIDGVKFSTADWSVKKATWGLLKYGSPAANNTLGVLCGNVYYPVTLSAIPNFPPDLVAIANTSIILFTEIGEVSPSLSREELSYDTVTCKNIIAKLQAARDEFLEESLGAVKNAPTVYEASRIYSNIPQNILNIIASNTRLQYLPYTNNKKILQEIHKDGPLNVFKIDLSAQVSTYPDICVYKIEGNYAKRKTFNWPDLKLALHDVDFYTHNNFQNLPDYVAADLAAQPGIKYGDLIKYIWIPNINEAKYRQRIVQYCNEIAARSYYAYAIGYFILNSGTFDFWENEFKRLGIPLTQLHKGEDILPDENKITPKKRQSNKVKAYVGVFRGGFLDVHSTENSVDLSTTGYYGAVYDGNILQCNFTGDSPIRAATARPSEALMQYLGFDTRKSIIFLRLKNLGPIVEKRFQKAGWVSIRSVMDKVPRDYSTKFKNTVWNNYVAEQLTTTMPVMGEYSYSSMEYRNIFYRIKTLAECDKPKLINKEIIDFINHHEQMPNSYKLTNHDLYGLMHLLENTEWLEEIMSKARKPTIGQTKIKSLLEKYPLFAACLRLVEDKWKLPNLTQDVINYLNTKGEDTNV